MIVRFLVFVSCCCSGVDRPASLSLSLFIVHSQHILHIQIPHSLLTMFRVNANVLMTIDKALLYHPYDSSSTTLPLVQPCCFLDVPGTYWAQCLHWTFAFVCPPGWDIISPDINIPSSLTDFRSLLKGQLSSDSFPGHLIGNANPCRLFVSFPAFNFYFLVHITNNILYILLFISFIVWLTIM